MAADEQKGREWNDPYTLSFLDDIYEPHEKFSNLTDFTIICKDGVKVPTFKLLLATRSHYFAALFRQEPERSTLALGFEGHLVKKIIESPILIDLSKGIEDLDEVFQLFEIADYFQMDALVLSITKMLFDEFFKEIGFVMKEMKTPQEIYQIVDFIEKFEIPKKKRFIDDFRNLFAFHIRKWMEVFDLEQFPRSVLKRLTNSEMDETFWSWPYKRAESPKTKIPDLSPFYVIDKYGKAYDSIKSDLILVQSLVKVDPNGNWNFSFGQMLKAQYALKRYDIRGEMDDDEITAIEKHLKPLEGMDLGEEFYARKLDRDFEWKKRFNEVTKKTVKLGPYGTAQDILRTLDVDSIKSWAIKGNFRKISVKTRLWDEKKVIQGLRIGLEDGTVKAFGMDPNDEVNVVTLEVTPGYHIRDVTLRHGWYIDQIQFNLNGRNGSTLGPVGGRGGHRSDVSPKYPFGDFDDIKRWYLEGINGIVIEAQGAPIIAQLQFTFAYFKSGEFEMREEFAPQFIYTAFEKANDSQDAEDDVVMIG